MKIVLINVDFIDAYTGEIRKAGSKAKMTSERIAEIKAVNPEFVSVIGIVDEPVQAEDSTEPVIEPVEAPKGKKKS